MEALLLAAMRFLPVAIDAGVAVAPLLKEVLNAGSDGSKPPLSPLGDYAFNVLSQVPLLLSSKDEVTAILKRANEQLGLMIRQGNRAPTPDEWDEINGKIQAKLREINAPGS